MHDNRFYDSETKSGVKRYKWLACNRRCVRSYDVNNTTVFWEDLAPKAVDVEEFKSIWNRFGAGQRFHWRSRLETDLENLLGELYKVSTPIFVVQ